MFCEHKNVHIYSYVLEVPSSGGRFNGALWNLVQMEVFALTDMVILLELSLSISNLRNRFAFFLSDLTLKSNIILHKINF